MSLSDEQRRKELAEIYLENCRDIRNSISHIEDFLLSSDVKRIMKMFQIFEAIAVTNGLKHNEKFTEAFSNYSFEEMAKLVDKVTIANEILTDYIDQLTTISGSETETSSPSSS